MNLSLSLRFLNLLKENNNKAWFDANRPLYEEARQEFITFVEALIEKLTIFDPELGTITSKDCIFRINRDLRFSKDKRPYKNHFGAYIATKGGRKSIYAGYYLHVQPYDDNFLTAPLIAGGVYCPEPKTLRMIRNDIYDYTNEYKKLINHPDFISNFQWLEETNPRSNPKGFPKDFPDIDLLKRKEYTFYHTISPELLADSKNLLPTLYHYFTLMKPLNDFYNRAIDYHLNVEQEEKL